MIMNREQLVFFEKLQKNQYRIWPDACDVGVRLYENNVGDIRHHLAVLIEDCEIVERFDSRGQWCRKFWLPVEYEGLAEAGYEISFLHYNQKGVEFVSVEVNRARRPRKAA